MPTHAEIQFKPGKRLLRWRLLRRPMEDYRGLHVGCAPGTHAAVVGMVSRHMAGRAGVLDIGAHSGALLKRLGDAGFTDLAAADLDTTVFSLPGVPLTRMDANQKFAHLFSRRFNLVVCTDIVEHLDSPRAFLAEARELLTDDGYLAFSVPNVAFWEGRLKFAVHGELWGFGHRNYVAQRHISPITVEQGELLLREVGSARSPGRPAAASPR
jgi:2-polyprenyl-3-methyl-5-hydroxy-6-metoxy-1,4-benzoquinol methylase